MKRRVIVMLVVRSKSMSKTKTATHVLKQSVMVLMLIPKAVMR